MGYVGEVDRGPSFRPFVELRAQLGFVPNLFRGQTLLPDLVEAEIALVSTVLFRDESLSRVQKEMILLTLSAANRNRYCAAIHYQMLRLLSVPEARLNQILAGYRNAGLSAVNAALVELALTVGLNQKSITQEDVANWIAQGLTDEGVLEAVIVIALGNFLCSLSVGLGAIPDFPIKQLPVPETEPIPDSARAEAAVKSVWQPLLPAPESDASDFAPFAFLQQHFGHVPSVFRAQTRRRDVVEAEVNLIRRLLGSDGQLTPTEKEYILAGDQAPEFTESGKALRHFADKLLKEPSALGENDVNQLRAQGVTDPQILEAVATAALSSFLYTLERGLGTEPDLRLRRDFRRLEPQNAHLSIAEPRHTDVALAVDPDAELVSRVRSGDLDAFEALMARNSKRVYRTLMGLLGDVEEARDAMQDAFLKAFQSISGFEGRSKFSTWLVSIASNTGLQRLRDRKRSESLDDREGGAEESFRPRQIRAWADDPEQMYSQVETRSLIEGAVMKLPSKYRVVLILRDIEQLGVEDAASALSLSIPAFKARLLRGRLMLREVLAPHFTAPASSANVKGVTP